MAGDGLGGAAGGADAGFHGLQVFQLARGEHHLRPLRGKGGGDRLADAAAGAGDHGDFSV